ncbi:MAG: hypothetical protein HYY93_14255, partial [Planctomycetes bacterium]|nr:hypothetical protein [Planctomycetota bacterium]
MLGAPSPHPLLGPRHTTFRRLVEDLFAEVRATAGRPAPFALDPLAHFLLVEAAVAEARPPYFASQFRAGTPYRGFVAECRALFLELKQARIGPEDFRTAVSKMPESMRPKGQAIADLFDAVESRRRRAGALDEADVLSAAIEAVRDTGRPLRPIEGVTRCRMEDVYDCTALQFDLLVALAGRIGGTVPIRFLYDPDR